MTHRINPHAAGANSMKSLWPIGTHLSKCSVEEHLLNLVYFRASQINGCAYCLDMHSKDLLIKGETPQRLFVLDAWRETALFSDRERAALAWTEEVTRIRDGQVSDAVYNEALSQFSEQELIDLTLAITVINTYNRINIAFKVEGGSYQPRVYTAKAKAETI